MQSFQELKQRVVKNVVKSINQNKGYESKHDYQKPLK